VNAQYQKKEKDTQPKIGERIISYFIGIYVKIRYRIWMLRKESNESKSPLQNLSRICLEHTSPVTSPLALISQIEGFGGSFLNQLFDGHPELHIHPHELMIGYTEKHVWPKIDLDDRPERWFEILFEDIVNEHNREGYRRVREDNETFPFIFVAALQREIFLNYLDSIQSIALRDVFNAYMTSYFGAWLSNQNYYSPKKFVTAYTRKLALIKENMEFFFEVYPDGRVISVVRDVKSWFSSAGKRWPGGYADIGQALSAWNDSAQEMLWNKERYGDRVCLIKFEDLVSKTEAVMLYLAEYLGIEFQDILLVPTFNTLPLEINTSFQEEDHGEVNSHRSREETGTAEELNTIDRMTGEIYQLVLTKVVKFE
jgi:hypothetical protein